jgi:hypothetical protein
LTTIGFAVKYAARCSLLAGGIPEWMRP